MRQVAKRHDYEQPPLGQPRLRQGKFTFEGHTLRARRSVIADNKHGVVLAVSGNAILLDPFRGPESNRVQSAEEVATLAATPSGSWNGSVRGKLLPARV